MYQRHRQQQIFPIIRIKEQISINLSSEEQKLITQELKICSK